MINRAMRTFPLAGVSVNGHATPCHPIQQKGRDRARCPGLIQTKPTLWTDDLQGRRTILSGFMYSPVNCLVLMENAEPP